MTKRLVAAAVALVAAMLVILGVPFLRSVEQYERERLRADLERDAVVLATGAEDQLSDGHPSAAVLDAMGERYAKRTGARVVIIDAAGVVLADSASGGDAGA